MGENCELTAKTPLGLEQLPEPDSIVKKKRKKGVDPKQVVFEPHRGREAPKAEVCSHGGEKGKREMKDCARVGNRGM